MTDFMHFLPGYLSGILPEYPDSVLCQSIGLSYAAFLLGVATPGPNVLALIGTSTSVGRTVGMALAIGIAMGSLTWGLLTALGVSALLLSYVYALTIIKIIGGIYLLWLAYNAFKSAAVRSNLTLKTLAGDRRTPFGYAIGDIQCK